MEKERVAHEGSGDRFLIGLGNPGHPYEQTRHNVGFRVIDRLWRAHGHGQLRKACLCEYRIGVACDYRVFMARPAVYMNESGRPIAELLRQLGGSPGSVLVIHDDIDLPVGGIRFRRGGSSGGHRGVVSLIEALGGSEFERLKIGVGHPGVTGGDVVDFVLSPPIAEEAALLSRAESTAAEAAWLWVTEGIESCMNRFNQKAVGAEEGKR